MPPALLVERQHELILAFSSMCSVPCAGAKISQDNGGVAEMMFDLAKLELDKENSVVASATLQVRKRVTDRIAPAGSQWFTQNPGWLIAATRAVTELSCVVYHLMFANIDLWRRGWVQQLAALSYSAG